MKKVIVTILMLLFCASSIFAQSGKTAAFFDGTNDYLSLGGAYYQYTSTFTVEAWVYHASWSVSSDEKIISCQTSGAGWYIDLDNNGNVEFLLGNGSYSTCQIATSNLTPGWHHLAITYNSGASGGTMNFWIDGSYNAEITGQAISYPGETTVIGTHTDGSDDFNGYIDEVRFWSITLAQAQIQEWMHQPITSSNAPSNVSSLRGYYKLDTDWPTSPNELDDCGNDVGGGADDRDMTNYGCSFSDQTTPMGEFPIGYITDIEAIWHANQSNWSDESTGLALQDWDAQTINTIEFYTFANDGNTGTTTADLPVDIDERATTIWFLDDVANDRSNWQFDLSDFGASGLEVSGLAASNYVLLRRLGTSGDFTTVETGATISSGNVTFIDYTPSGDAYYTIGRDNNPATLTTTTVSNIDQTTTSSGGNIPSDGGGNVTARGVCWSTSGTPTIADNYTTDGSGTGSFTSSLTGLSVGTNYYVRAYATNTEGTAYGNEVNFTTLDAVNSFTDGSSFSPTVTLGQNDQALGRFSLSADVTGSSFTGASVILNGTRTGASNFRLWSSIDASFEVGSDTQLGSTVAADPGDGNSVSFSSFSSSIATSAGYYFVTCDVSVDATGIVQGIVGNNAALTLDAGEHSGTITNAPLSGGDVSLPVELTFFTANTGDGKVTLKWSTASEINNDAFIIERSDDGEQFELLTEIKGQGSTSSQTDYSFTDNSVFNGFTYYYRLADRDINGVVTWHMTINATPNAKAIDFEQTGVIVEKFALHSNYPNPFNPETSIRFDVPTLNGELKNIKLQIYNSVGQLITTLYEGQISGGQYEMKWNAANQPSGVYFLNFQSEQFVQSQKMILLR